MSRGRQVPRNVDDEGLNALPRVVAYNVDDLKQVVAANQVPRPPVFY